MPWRSKRGHKSIWVKMRHWIALAYTLVKTVIFCSRPSFCIHSIKITWMVPFTFCQHSNSVPCIFIGRIFMLLVACVYVCMCESVCEFVCVQFLYVLFPIRSTYVFKIYCLSGLRLSIYWCVHNNCFGIYATVRKLYLNANRR